jgi:hypothetical protein
MFPVRALAANPTRSPWPLCGCAVACALAAAAMLAGVLAAVAQEPAKGLAKEQVIKLLREDPASRVEYLVNKYGVAFYCTPDIETELRGAGATPGLLDLIRKLAPQKPAEVKPPSPPPPTLVIHAKPGQSEVYVDDEPRGQTGADGALKLDNMAAGTHKLRVSLTGYRSFELGVDLAAGETNTVVAELQPIPPAPPPVEKEPAKESKAPPIEQKPPANPDDPMTPHAPGIYYFQQAANASHLVELEEAPPDAGALGGRSSRGGFPGIKSGSMIYGGQARVRVAGARPVFYFYFPTLESDASTFGVANDALRHTATPNGFVLVRLRKSKSLREIPVKGSGAVEEKDTVAFDYEKTAIGIFKVQPKSDLGPGEYGFLYGGVLRAAGQTWLFDFGIDKGQ